MPNKEEKEIVGVENETVAETVNTDIPNTNKEAGFVPARKSFKERRKNERRAPRRPEKARQEFDNKIISLRRVTRVVAGGRRFSFSIAMVIGDKKGRVGVGTGKAGDTPIAVEKAMQSAKKNLMTIPLSKNNSINHQVEAKYSSARVSVMPAPGKGVIAGSAVRTVLELAGIREVSSKILSRSKNKLNIAKATIKALGRLKKSK